MEIILGSGERINKYITTNNLQITHLKVTGALNGADIRYLRQMTGCEDTGGKLEYLDLSEATIIASNDIYIQYEKYNLV